MLKAVLLQPLINEKSMNLVKSGFFTFVIDRDATKEEVAKVVSEKFKVDVLSVRTVNRVGKEKTQPSRKGYFTTKGTKRAVVKLKKGQTITLFENPGVEEEVEVKTAEGNTKGKAESVKGEGKKTTKKKEGKE